MSRNTNNQDMPYRSVPVRRHGRPAMMEASSGGRITSTDKYESGRKNSATEPQANRANFSQVGARCTMESAGYYNDSISQRAPGSGRLLLVHGERFRRRGCTGCHHSEMPS